MTYDPYNILLFNEPGRGEIVRFDEAGNSVLGQITDVYVPTVAVRRIDGIDLNHDDRAVAVDLATGLCKELGLLEADISRMRALFYGDEWVFYDLCGLPANSRVVMGG